MYHDVTGSNLVEALIFFLGFFRNCIIAFSIARIILHLIILRSLNLEFTLP